MNEEGNEFLQRAREIIDECSKLDSPARAARVAVFAMCVILDGSREAVGTQYKLITEDDKLVKFIHNDL